MPDLSNDGNYMHMNTPINIGKSNIVFKLGVIVTYTKSYI